MTNFTKELHPFPTIRKVNHSIGFTTFLVLEKNGAIVQKGVSKRNAISSIFFLN